MLLEFQTVPAAESKGEQMAADIMFSLWIVKFLKHRCGKKKGQKQCFPSLGHVLYLPLFLPAGHICVNKKNRHGHTAGVLHL